MQSSFSTTRIRTAKGPPAGWLLFGTLLLLLWLPDIGGLWRAWQIDSSLSHGPVIPLIAGWLLYGKREALCQRDSRIAPGFVLLLLSALLYVLSVWADIVFFKYLALIGIAGGLIGYLNGTQALRAAGGGLSFLLFMLPWPTTLVERLAFPMQLASSTYAALFAGLLGVPIHRNGVHLSVQPNPDAAPIYSIVVAQQCSGLTSLLVLLTLAYLIAAYTEVSMAWRALLFGIVVPLALVMNTLRLTLILLAGAYWNAGAAQWIHDNEAPVLIFLCSTGLLGLRYLLLSGLTAWRASALAEREEVTLETPSPADS